MPIALVVIFAILSVAIVSFGIYCAICDCRGR